MDKSFSSDQKNASQSPSESQSSSEAQMSQDTKNQSVSHSGTEIIQITRLSELADHYSVFVFPIFGTLHNGQSLSEEAFTCLQNLADLGKTVTIFSNVPKRRHVLIQDLASLGVPPSLYQHVIASGEVAYHALKMRNDPFHARLGKRAYIYGSSDALRMIEGLDIKKTTFLDEADFLLALGPDEWHSDLNYYKPSLRAAKKHNLPMVCVSPDLHVEYQGERSIRAGSIAAYYEELGGDVFYHGKPYRPFYKSLLADLDPFQPKDILVLGDSYLTDIKGASKIGLDSVLCLNETTKIDFELSGLQSHYKSRKSKQKKENETVGAILDPMKIMRSLLQEQDYAPKYLMERLKW